MCLKVNGRTGESREEFNRGRWEGEGWEKVPEGGRWKVGGKRVVCSLLTHTNKKLIALGRTVYENHGRLYM